MFEGHLANFIEKFVDGDETSASRFRVPRLYDGLHGQGLDRRRMRGRVGCVVVQRRLSAKRRCVVAA